jgi:mannose/fructose/N-acetylgalactosamine-specific phosphotransferase system component IIC
MGNKTLVRLLIALGIIGVIAAILHFRRRRWRHLQEVPLYREEKSFRQLPDQ